MKISVKDLAGKTLSLDVNPTDTIRDIKEKQKSKDGTAINEQRLIFAGRQLEDDKTLAQCNIKDGSIVVCAMLLCCVFLVCWDIFIFCLHSGTTRARLQQ